ncbi:hypothetical protein GH714_019988 [Hevea brasiliensis]|uniref:Uncharacterized protein n=1 Tax=Hevea brasiliensis TaxID=3981 RepID=A0A6A6M9A4_HEVBR|nr:hypothetical protein GH714_019988 [Hevea brasiliensis]
MELLLLLKGSEQPRLPILGKVGHLFVLLYYILHFDSIGRLFPIPAYYGLRWHAKRLKIDEDGDVADEFLEEVLPETSSCVDDHHKPLPRFEVKYSARPAKIKNQVISHDGKFQVCVEYQGRLQWV